MATRIKLSPEEARKRNRDRVKKWYIKTENREYRLVYLKQWRSKNKERIAEYNKGYRTRVNNNKKN